MTQKQRDAMIRSLKKHQAKLAKERDAIRDLLAEFDQVADDADEAHELVCQAVDILSQLQ